MTLAPPLRDDTSLDTRHHTRTPQVARFRPDIEGLRAWAVGLVVADHLFGWPRGGFIGVDVFFVISGYLITGLLLKESAHRGSVSIANFYTRRARRILPAAAATTLFVLIAAHFAFLGERIRQTVTDVEWASVFAANIHFSHIGTDYFEANRAPSLVQHYWSLAVEEQFYLVWPLVVLALAVLLRRRHAARALPRAVLVAAFVTCFVSFGWALHKSVTSPASAYFATDARAWELAIGAAIASATTAFAAARAASARWGARLSLIGLGGIAASSLLINPSSTFPAPTAAYPALATGLVLYAGTAATDLGRLGVLLTNPVSRYLGRISYSMYLWHWPIILILAEYIPRSPSTSYRVAALAAILAASIASYTFIEAPFHAQARTSTSGRWQPALAVLGLAVTMLVAIHLKPAPPAPSFMSQLNAALAGSPTVPGDDGSEARPTRELATQIRSALSLDRWPHLEPSLQSINADSAKDEWAGCIGATEATLSACTFGDAAHARHRVVVIGDSYAMSWLPAVEAALTPHGWVVHGLAQEMCPAEYVRVDNGHQPPQHLSSCDERHRYVLGAVARLKPDLVILASTDSTIARLSSKATVPAAQQEIASGLARTVNEIRRSGTTHVLVLAPPPGAMSFDKCAPKYSTPADCITLVSTQWRDYRDAQREGARLSGATYVDTHLWFCVGPYCPSVIGNTPVRWDGVHLCAPYARRLGRELFAAIEAEVFSAR